jgi:lipoic acid synthetase
MSKEPSRNRVNPEVIDTTPIRRPSWIKVRAPSGETYDQLRDMIRSKALHTVCEEANCPNMGECWGSGTATFLILGDVCTRRCGFCDIKHGKPLPIDWQEPEHVAQAVKAMDLSHAVITSVDRDDDNLGGAKMFAKVIERIREVHPGCSIEVLIPDFQGDPEALKIVMEARPEILNHNLETVERLFPSVQPSDKLEWSQAVLVGAKQMDSDVLTKSGLMLGLGETLEEIRAEMELLRKWDVDILTIGQYLQPSRQHLPVTKYYALEGFEALKEFGLSIGFRWVESSPLVRSSYHAADQVRALSAVHKALYSAE